jgi:hypothetical protein
MKRLFDIIASGLGLLVLSPLFLILAIWIKLDSKGPVFYRQVRVGKDNKDFRIFKFRSMRVGSDKGSLVTIGGRDPRITRSGYIIRKLKLDELPQLINVFVGDMSLVGPRPEVRHYVEYWTEEQMHVLDVRPGGHVHIDFAEQTAPQLLRRFLGLSGVLVPVQEQGHALHVIAGLSRPAHGHDGSAPAVQGIHPQRPLLFVV